MILTVFQHRNYELRKMKPHKKTCVKIYNDEGVFMQTCNNPKDATRLIDFCQKNKVWK